MIGTHTKFLGMTLALALSAVLAPSLARADVLTLTSEPTGFTMGGVYTSPYLITINGTSTKLMACDDFTTDISNGQSWQADKISLAQAPTLGKFKTDGVTIPNADGTSTTSHPEYTITEKYQAAGWLAEQLLAVLSSPNQTVSGQYSFAIWQIFYSGAINGYGGNHLNSTDEAAVGALMTDAFANSASITHEVFFYTPTGVQTGDQLATSQEFIGVGPLLGTTPNTQSVPEASTTTFLAFNFVALPLMLFGIRRRYRSLN